eukprot:scaffold111741_cov67-Phaeocystis_antarctica.AAC.2
MLASRREARQPTPDVPWQYEGVRVGLGIIARRTTPPVGATGGTWGCHQAQPSSTRRTEGSRGSDPAAASSWAHLLRLGAGGVRVIVRRAGYTKGAVNATVNAKKIACSGPGGLEMRHCDVAGWFGVANS